MCELFAISSRVPATLTYSLEDDGYVVVDWPGRGVNTLQINRWTANLRNCIDDDKAQSTDPSAKENSGIYRRGST